MKNGWAFVLILALIAGIAPALVGQPSAAVPKYNPTTEGVFKGTVVDVSDRQCPVSGGMGSHIVLKLDDNSTIEVHLALTKFVKSYDLVFNKGDVVEVTGSKLKLEGVDTILAREVKRGNDTFVFRDKEGKPVW